MADPLRLLAIASRPSDYVEMADLARALAARRHDVSLLYLYSRDDPSAPRMLEQLSALSSETGVNGVAVEVSELPPAMPVFDTTTPVEAAPGPPASATYPDVRPAAVNVLRSVALWARRRGLHLYPKNTIVGRAAYGAMHAIDSLSDRQRRARARALFGSLRGRLRRLPLSMRFEAPIRVYQAAATLSYYERFAAFFRQSIANRRIDAILIPEDIVGSIWPVAIRAGHDSGIPALVLPYTLANREEAIQSLKGAPSYQTRPSRVAAALYPRWRYREGSIDIVRLPSGHIFAHEDLGIAPADPWMMNSGDADKVLVDSRAAFEYFLAGGLPREQLQVVGSVSQDRMFALHQARSEHLAQLRRELSLPDVKPLLVISGCPNQLTATVPFCEFTTIEDVAAFVGASVSPLREHYHLVVRPHPNFTDFGRMLEPFGVKTTERPTASLVPLADLFIAFASATIRWAIACGTPTVNYDVFHYGYGEFAAAKGVASVSGSAEFRNLARGLVPGAPAYQALASQARHDRAEWSVMDGRSIERIEQEIHEARSKRMKIVKEQPQHA